MAHIITALSTLAVIHGLMMVLPVWTIIIPHHTSKSYRWYHKLISPTGNAYNTFWLFIPVIVIKDFVANYPGIWLQEYYEVNTMRGLHQQIKFRFSRQFARDLELMGHEIEVQYYGIHHSNRVSQYRKSEARTLTRYKQFKGVSTDTIYYMMSKLDLSAKSFVMLNKHKVKY